MRLRFEPRIMGSRIRPFDTDRELLCAPTLLTSHLVGEVKWKQSRGDCTISEGWIPGSLLLWRACCAQREEQRKGLWVSFLHSTPYPLPSWTGWRTQAVPKECVAGSCICGASGEPVGPKRGRCSRTQDFIWPFIMAIFIWPFILLVASSLQWATDKHWPN